MTSSAQEKSFELGNLCRAFRLPRDLWFIRSVLFVAYVLAEVIIFLRADKPRNRLASSLQGP